MTEKFCIITGANSGIGKAASVQIAKKGHHVIMACRNRQRGKAALEDVKRLSGSDAVELMIVDMSLQSSIRDFSHLFMSKYERLDVLIHNAAHFDITQKNANYTCEGIESVWATNHLGPVMMTDILMDHLKKSDQGRIITVSSKGLVVFPFLKVNVDDPEFKSRRFSMQNAYYQSKLAQVMYTYWLADKLKNTDMTVNCVRVTNVKIDLSRYPGLSTLSKWLYVMKSRFSISPDDMAKTYTYLALSDEVRLISGGYFDSPVKQVKSSRYSYQKKSINRLMSVTYHYLQ